MCPPDRKHGAGLAAFRTVRRWFLLGLCWHAATGRLSAHGELQAQIDSASNQLKATPQRADLYWFRANLYFQHRQWNDALDDLENVDRFSPHTFPTDLLRGEARAAGGDDKSARLALNKFLAEYPGHGQALTVRARVLCNLGEQAASVADYRAALKAADAPQPDLYLEVANAVAAAGEGPEAVQILEGSLKTLGQLPSLATRTIELEIALNRVEDALQLIARMQESSPRPETWMARRAGVLAQVGRTGEARAVWQALVDRLALLPDSERGSHAMLTLAEKARQALTPTVDPPVVPSFAPR